MSSGSCTPTTNRTAPPRPSAWWAAGRVNLYAAISAGIAALWGPLHGGANQAVSGNAPEHRLQRPGLDSIMSNAPRTRTTVPAHGLRPPGLQNLRSPGQDHEEVMCDEVLDKLKIERSAACIWPRNWRRSRCSDDYFIEHNLYPNVDFYSGIMLRAMGIPTNMFTVMFAIGRLPGLDCPMEGKHGRSQLEAVPPAPDLHRPGPAGLRSYGGALKALKSRRCRRETKPPAINIEAGLSSVKRLLRLWASAAPDSRQPLECRPYRSLQG